MIAQLLDLASIPRFLLFLVPLLVSVPVVIFLVYFIVKAVKERELAFILLAMLFWLATVSLAFQLVAGVSPRQDVAVFAFVAWQLAEIAALVVLVAILSMFERSQAFSWKVATFGLLAALLFGAVLQDPKVIAEPVSTVLGPAFALSMERAAFATAVYVVFTLLGLAWVIQSFVTRRRQTRNKEQRKLITWLFAGIVLAFAIGSLTPVALESRGDAPLRDLAQNVGLAKVVGMMIVGIAFAKVSTTPWLLQLQANHVLMVQSLNGIPMYSKTFRDDISEMDLQMLAGAISAVSSLFRESTKETTPLESLSFNGKVVKLVTRDGFTCALMVDYVSRATNAALDAFVAAFKTRFHAEIERFSGNVGAFDGAGVLAARYFTR